MASIAELLMAQGAQAAEARRRLGEIQGNMWSNIGQSISQIPGQIEQQKRLSQENELRSMQLNQARQQQAGQGVLDRAMQGGVPNGPQEQGQPPAEAQHPYLDENGLWDVSKLQGVLADRGMAHLAPDLLKSAENINDSITKHQAAQQKEAETRTIMYGDLADGTQKLTKAGTPIDQAMDLVVAPALASKRISPQEYQQLKQHILSLPPDQQQAALQTAMDAAERVAPSETLAEGAKRKGRYGTTLAANAPKPTAPTRASIALQASGGDPNAALGLLQTPTAPKSLQSESDWEVDGKSRPVIFNPATGARYLSEADVAANKPIDPTRLKKIPPASVLAMNAQIPDIALTEKQKKIAADLASGLLSFPDFNKIYPSRGGAGAAVKQAVYLEARDINPDFNPTAFEAGQKMFSSTAIRQRMTAIDQLTPVIKQINDIVQKSGNTDLPTLNRVLQAAKFQLGGENVTDLRQLQTLLGDEVGNALGVGTGSDLKTRLGLDLVNPQLGPSQFASTMRQLQSVLGARRNALAAMMGPYGKETEPGNTGKPTAEELIKKYGGKP